MSNMNPNDFMAALADLLTAETAKDRGVGKLRAVRKRFETMGCDMPALALFLTLRKLEPDERQARLKNALRYAQWAEMNIGDQASLFPGVDDKPAHKAAQQWTHAQVYEEGYAAGKAGRAALDNRFSAGTEEAAKHFEGWTDGQAYLIAELGREPTEGEVLQPAKRTAKKKAGTPVAGKPRGRGKGARGVATI